MGRQTQLGGIHPAGAGRLARLDPLALPVRFTASDAAADGRERQIEIDRHRVLLRRSVRGIAIRLRLPIDAFLGVSVRLVPDDTAGAGESVLVRLEHRDPALAVELHCGPDDDDVIAEWQLWSRVLGLPLLVADRTGRLTEPMARLGAVQVAEASPRRRRRNSIGRRRPRMPLRRRAGNPAIEQPVHDGREIIARN